MSWWCGVAVLVAWVAAVLTIARAIGYGMVLEKSDGAGKGEGK